MLLLLLCLHAALLCLTLTLHRRHDLLVLSLTGELHRLLLRQPPLSQLLMLQERRQQSSLMRAMRRVTHILLLLLLLLLRIAVAIRSLQVRHGLQRRGREDRMLEQSGEGGMGGRKVCGVKRRR